MSESPFNISIQFQANQRFLAHLDHQIVMAEIAARKARMAKVREYARELRSMGLAVGCWNEPMARTWRQGYRRAMREARDWQP